MRCRAAARMRGLLVLRAGRQLTRKGHHHRQEVIGARFVITDELLVRIDPRLPSARAMVTESAGIPGAGQVDPPAAGAVPVPALGPAGRKQRLPRPAADRRRRRQDSTPALPPAESADADQSLCEAYRPRVQEERRCTRSSAVWFHEAMSSRCQRGLEGG